MKRVILSARTPEGEDRTEECDLLEESDPIYDAFGKVMDGSFDALAKAGYVLFADADGLFVVRPEEVRNIHVLSENGTVG